MRTMFLVGLLTVMPYIWAEDVEEVARGLKWQWSDHDASILYSLGQWEGNYEIQIVPPKNSILLLMIRVVDDTGREIISWHGHAFSAFRARGDMLYYADYSFSGNGCSVVEYDLKQRKQIWRTELQGLGFVQHSAYENMVNFYISDRYIRFLVTRATASTPRFWIFTQGKHWFVSAGFAGTLQSVSFV